ncbi:MBL fold metallo-hydrolase [Paenibacillus cellulositrophicus]|uniref:MBL fold metallo-hydrolase n=1 Tax=Paenibacillus cellulositrophicus TaxID=562959 RepID=UPI00203E4432|nr:MBL fold metallo-hydrolase [Paenibacillus cellulositrophicus]MCM3000368.1 MBL fold metallo-hydrolase [Paenibacillus cellulositrophicus]
MKMTTVQQVTQVAFMPRLFPVNVYLVEEEDGLTLIDAGMPFSIKGIQQAAARLGKPIVRIVLTHAHGDHIGAFDLLKAALPQVTTYISRRDSRLLAGNKELEPGEPQEQVRGDIPAPGKVTTKPDVLLEDGDRIGSLLAVASPGHTPGHMAFYDTRSGVLIAGDAFQTRAALAVSGHMQPLFPFPAMATWSKATSIASAKRLAGLNPTWLAVGHGKMIPQPTDKMAIAISRAEEALKKGAV